MSALLGIVSEFATVQAFKPLLVERLAFGFLGARELPRPAPSGPPLVLEASFMAGLGPARRAIALITLRALIVLVSGASRAGWRGISLASPLVLLFILAARRPAFLGIAGSTFTLRVPWRPGSFLVIRWPRRPLRKLAAFDFHRSFLVPGAAG